MSVVVRLTPLLAFVALTACGGAATNAEWVQEPEGGGSIGQQPVALDHDAVAETTSDYAPKNGPQRLDHTVTLGSVFVAPPDPSSPSGPPPASVTINLNNYNGGGYGTPYYGGYGYVPYYAGGGFRPGGGFPSGGNPSHGGGSSTIQPGQSWPSVPSYGPAFPYHTGPASPWETRR